MNDCAPSEGFLLEGDGREIILKVFQDCRFSGFALPNFEQRMGKGREFRMCGAYPVNRSTSASVTQPESDSHEGGPVGGEKRQTADLGAEFESAFVFFEPPVFPLRFGGQSPDS